MTSITWAGPRCVQELPTILAPQNHTQGRCGVFWNRQEILLIMSTEIFKIDAS